MAQNSGGKRTQVNVYYDFEDYDQDFLDDCELFFLSQRTAWLCVAGLKTAEYINTRWLIDGNTIDPADQETRQQIKTWVDTALEEITMSCNEDLDRIATALESLAANQAVRYTVQDALDDISDVFGTGHILYDMVSAFFGLFPRLKVKIDASGIVRDTIVTYTRYTPIHLNLIAIASALTAIAATQASAKVMDLINVGINALDFLAKTGEGWKNLLVGDGTTLWDLLKAIRDAFIADEDGGTGGVDPDNDASLRTIVNVQARNEINNLINACCIGVPNVPQQDIDRITPLEQPGTVSPTEAPIAVDGITWTTARSAAGRCIVAWATVEWMQDVFAHIDNDLPDAPLSPAQIIGVVGGIAIVAATAPPMAIVALIGFAAALAGLSISGTLKAAVGQIRTVLFEHAGDLVCALYDADDVSQSILQFGIVLEDTGLPGPLVTIVKLLATPTVVSHIYWAASETSFAGYSGQTDCTECDVDACPDYLITHGVEIGPYEFDSVLDTWWRVDILLNTNHENIEGPWCGPELAFQILTDGWSASTNPVSDFRVWADSDAPFTSTNPTNYNSDTHPGSTVLNGRWLHVSSNTPFTLEILPFGS